MNEPLVVELDSGIKVGTLGRTSIDKEAVRTLVESGVPMAEVAKVFHVTKDYIKLLSREGGWLTPSRVSSMRKEIGKKQVLNLRRAGQPTDVVALKAQIWAERGEALKEKTYQIAKAALEGVSDEHASRFVQNPLGLAHLTTVVRQITGEQQLEDSKKPQMAVNIAFLRPSAPTDVVLDAEEV
jgi:hypothetical protein